MKIHYMGKYNGDADSLPCLPHKPNAVKFKEAENDKKLSVIANIASIVLLIPMFFIYYKRAENLGAFDICIGALLTIVILLPHEYLHAICYKKDAYVYTNLKRGMLFVTGPEDMSKSRFIFMCMLPNLVFGFIPFAVFLVFPKLTILGAFSAVAICEGVGDYYNVFNALTQMPKGARTYLHGFNSYWYMP